MLVTQVIRGIMTQAIRPSESNCMQAGGKGVGVKGLGRLKSTPSPPAKNMGCLSAQYLYTSLYQEAEWTVALAVSWAVRNTGFLPKYWSVEAAALQLGARARFSL